MKSYDIDKAKDHYVFVFSIHKIIEGNLMW